MRGLVEEDTAGDALLGGGAPCWRRGDPGPAAPGQRRSEKQGAAEDKERVADKHHTPTPFCAARPRLTEGIGRQGE